MEAIQNIFRILGTRWDRPTLFGTFHIACIIASFVVGIVLCLLWKHGVIKSVKRVVLVTAIIVIVFEIYKQIMCGISYEYGLSYNYDWQTFPWQFCSTPMYIGLLAGISRGKIHDHFCAYLATFALFAGTAVMIYPATVFTSMIGICIQTMVCHGSMIAIAIFLYYTGHVKTEWKTLFKAIPVFAVTVTIAVILNTVMHGSGILPEGTHFSMFYVCPECRPELPIYSMVQEALMGYSWGYPVCLAIYILGFSLVAALMLLIAMGIKKVYRILHIKLHKEV